MNGEVEKYVENCKNYRVHYLNVAKFGYEPLNKIVLEGIKDVPISSFCNCLVLLTNSHLIKWNIQKERDNLIFITKINGRGICITLDRNQTYNRNERMANIQFTKSDGKLGKMYSCNISKLYDILQREYDVNYLGLVGELYGIEKETLREDKARDSYQLKLAEEYEKNHPYLPSMERYDCLLPENEHGQYVLPSFENLLNLTREKKIRWIKTDMVHAKASSYTVDKQDLAEETYVGFCGTTYIKLHVNYMKAHIHNEHILYSSIDSFCFYSFEYDSKYQEKSSISINGNNFFKFKSLLSNFDTRYGYVQKEKRKRGIDTLHVNNSYRSGSVGTFGKEFLDCTRKVEYNPYKKSESVITFSGGGCSPR